ncbi:MAG: DUF6088 family protein [Gracilibacteraceae bacterium]|jgi:hypothetical protein|nr:DUF6088 family protein [Gracilibacteraceae bacterium]
MEPHGYGQHIKTQIQNWPAKKPVTTKEVAASLASAFDMDIDNAKKITNVNMARLVDKGDLARVQRGVYGKVRETRFGKLRPRPDEIMTGFLLRDSENIIGYITGPTLLNALGLCSQIPAERHIASNRYRYRLPEDTRIRVCKPILTVNDANAPYLQALEAFMAMEKYPVDADRPDEVLRSMLRSGNINNERLIWYARNHCGRKTLLRAIDVTLGGNIN